MSHVETFETVAATDKRGNSARQQAVKKPALAYGALCPSCGGAIRITEGYRSVRCNYCGSSLLVLDTHGTKSFILDPSVSAGKARLAAIRWLTEESSGRLNARKAVIVDQKLIYVPFWRLRGRIVGWLTGERRRIAQGILNSQLVLGDSAVGHSKEERTSYSRLLFKRVDWSSPACMLPQLGLQGIALRTDLLEWNVLDPSRRRKCELALPTRTEELVRKEAMRYLASFATAAGTTVRASRFRLFDAPFSLYYYPIYLLRYRHGERLFTITVDALNGLITRGELPPRKKVDARKLFFLPAVLAVIAATYLPLVIVPILWAYIADSINSMALIPPKDWIIYRSSRLLGEGE